MSSIRSACYSWRKQTRFWAVCLSKAPASQLKLSWSIKDITFPYEPRVAHILERWCFFSSWGREGCFLACFPPLLHLFPCKRGCCDVAAVHVVLCSRCWTWPGGLRRARFAGGEMKSPRARYASAG